MKKSVKFESIKVWSLLVCAIVISGTINAQQCSDIFFSEYIEGSSNNKVLEVFNPTSSTVDISAYTFIRQANGGNVYDYTYNGTIDPGDVYIIANSSANQTILDVADTTSSLCWFNGDDGLAIVVTATGDTIDRIGVWDQDPGTEWAVGTGSTKEYTLVRMKSVSNGTKDWTVSQNEWDVYSQDVTTYLGFHSSDSCGGLNSPLISFTTSWQYVSEGKDSVFVNLTMVNPDAGATTVDLVLGAFTNGTDGVDFNFSSKAVTFPGGSNATQTVAIDLIDNSNWDELSTKNDAMNIILELQNATNSAVFGTDSILTIYIADDDFPNTPCTYPYFSEYGEGTSNNKYLEIYNPDNMKVDLSEIRVMLFGNGNTSATGVMTMKGWLDSYDTYLIANGSADSASIQSIADTVHSSSNYNVTWFNGNDAVLLIKGFCDTLDIIGVVGVDPGTEWVVDTGSTVEHTLIRRDTVSRGRSDWANASNDWMAYGQDYWTDIDQHTQTACTTPSCPDSLDMLVRGYPDTCFNMIGSAVVKSIGSGTTPYTYMWSTGETTSSISSLFSGDYTVWVWDAGGCADSATVTVADEVSAFTYVATISDAKCNQADGSVQIASLAGGYSPYVYDWSTGENTDVITGLISGTYDLTITDAYGCWEDTSFLVNDIGGPQFAVLYDDLACFGDNDGVASVSIISGISPYTYDWSTTETTDLISGLTADNYSVSVGDSIGCKTNANFTIIEPELLELWLDSWDVSCNGDMDGSAEVSAWGGVSPYMYSWSNSSTTWDVDSLDVGTYVVTVYDDNICMVYDTVWIDEPEALMLTITGTDAMCNGESSGTAEVSAWGGVTPYMYSWSTGESTWQLTSLDAGTYTATVMDDNGCWYDSSIVIGEPSALVVTMNSTNVLCNGDSNGDADVTASGGTGAYTYLWNTTATSQAISDLGAAAYSVDVTDDNNCVSTGNVTITEPNPIVISTDSTNESVTGAADGSASVAVTGGTGAYTYSWSNGANTATNTGLKADTYTVTVTDENDCVAIEEVTVNVGTGIFETMNNVGFKVYPNPSNGSFTLEVRLESKTDIIVYDYIGQSVYYDKIDKTGMITKEIAFENLPKGIYWIKLTNEQGVGLKKIIIN
ncbi:MAG: lamin tail domain-containing protein [Bacteroidia bacterium]|nr:lamin tail domain-containing protein [Bacteroidia bacterium]